MEVKSIHRYARISPLKARDVAREIQGLPVSHALNILNFTPRKAAHLIGKTLKSAVANAENNHDLSVETLVVKEATVGDGPTYKRYKPRARGSGAPVRKRTSHIRIILSEGTGDGEEPAADKKAKAKKPVAKKKAPAKKAAKKVAKAAAAAPEVVEEEVPAAVEAEPAPTPEVVEEAAAPAAEAAEAEAEAEAPAESAADVEAPEGLRYDEKLGWLYTESPPTEHIDDLKEISGVGEVLEEKLHSHGVYRYEQVANWSAENVASFDDVLNFKGRIERDDWLSQAKKLHDEKYG